jgi:predicted Fe-Mo cluster-binding NifX family protein
MKVCFAVEKDEGTSSKVYDHFGSAPTFILVDTEFGRETIVDNKDRNHVHGACNPIMAIGGQAVDAVVVGGIGAGALMKLNADGIKVYRSVKETVKDNLDLLKDNKLPELTVHHTCKGHQEGCGH